MYMYFTRIGREVMEVVVVSKMKSRLLENWDSVGIVDVQISVPYFSALLFALYLAIGSSRSLQNATSVRETGLSSRVLRKLSFADSKRVISAKIHCKLTLQAFQSYRNYFARL